MHPVRLLLVAAVLVSGCAADDSLRAGVDTTGRDVSVTPTTSTTPVPSAADASNTASVTDNAAPRTSTTAGDDSATTTTPDPSIPADATGDTATTTEALPSITTTTTASTTTTTTTTTANSTTTTSTATTTTTTLAPEPAVDGFTVFIDATCDTCHGADGRGGTGADLATSTLNLNSVIEVIRFGVEGTVMEGWDYEPKPPGLTRAQIEAVAAYVVSLRDG